MVELANNRRVLLHPPFEAAKARHLKVRMKDFPHPEVRALASLERLSNAKHVWGRASLCLITLLLFITPAHAVQPDEILKDANLEARARHISTGLRCLVCQNQSIDESDAPVARDLRILIREQLTANKSDAEIRDFVVARYGDYVLLNPRFSAKTLALWLSPFILLLAAFAFFFRSGKSIATPDTLTDTEKAELEALLRK